LKEPGKLFIGDSSCQDDFACSGASGTIGSNSCIGFNACSFVPFILGDGGIGEESKLLSTSFPKPIQGDFTKREREGSILFLDEQVLEDKKYSANSFRDTTKIEGSTLFQNKQVIEGEKYLAKSVLPFTRSLQEIQQPSIGDNSCSGSSSCELNIGNIGDASCTKGFDGNEPPSCIDNRGRIGNGSCTEHASCIGNRGSIGNGSW